MQEKIKDDMVYRQVVIDEIEYELEMINSALDSLTLDFNTRERLLQRKGEAREILNFIQQLPSAKPERKRGKWYDVGSLSCRCSECGCKSQKEYLFCPNCGVKIEKYEYER